MPRHSYESISPLGITHHDEFVEVARLINKMQLLIRALGGLLPGVSTEVLQGVTAVLEIPCGPGSWALEMAKAHPQMHITGVDVSHAMITFARSLVRDQAITNVEFLEIPDFVGSYPFNEASFDLISVQFVSKFLTVDAWPHFLSTCWRLLRPGGQFRLTEFETAFANAPGYEALSQLFIQAMHLAGRSFSPSSRHLGLLCELEPLLYAAGFQECSCTPHIVNYSYGAPLYKEWKKDFLIFSKEVQSLIVQTGLATQEQVDALHRQQAYEMDLPTFHAILPMLTIWGSKPTKKVS